MQGHYEKCVLKEKNVIIENTGENAPYTEIEAKAFFHCVEIEKLVLPSTVTKIGDWAFAHMKNLTELTVPAGEVEYGRKVFVGCEKLAHICLWGIDLEPEVTGLMATLVVKLEQPSPHAELVKVDGDTKSWFDYYDRCLIHYLEASDEEGFEPGFVGWFDVEDLDDQQARYVYERRKKKVEMCFQRLQYQSLLKPEMLQKLTAYLKGEENGVPTEELERIFGEEGSDFSNDVKCAKLWKEIGGFQTISANRFLQIMAAPDPEVRAYLLAQQLENREGGDFFEDMLL